MHDIRAIRDNPDAFKALIARRSPSLVEKVDEALRHDGAVRQAVTDKQAAETLRNTASKAIGAAKAKGDEAEFERLRAEVAKAKDTIETAGEQEEAARKLFEQIMAELPNVPMPDVPEGADEHGNVEVTQWGTPRDFDFEPKDHVALGEALGGMDFETAAKMSGARFVMLTGQLARLERALAAFMLDLQTTENDYTEVSPPYLVRDNALYGTGQLPKFEEDLFFASSFEKTNKSIEDWLNESPGNWGTEFVGDYSDFRQTGKDADGVPEFGEFVGNTRPIALKHRLIPTSEVPLTNIAAETIAEASAFPQRYTAHTPCFRSEAGSAGRDTRGMIRLHQFNKVELVSIVRTEEEGLAEHERMTACAEEVLKRLGLPFRRMLLCTGDMGFGARKTYDLEVWLPAQGMYREISSCSYCGDFQARRMNARWRPEATEDNPKPKPEFVHTLNGSGLAVGRTLVAVLENYQNEDGSITVPEALRPWMGGVEVIA